MKIALLSISKCEFVHGIREISSYLKKNGHYTEMFFLTAPHYNEALLKQLSNRLSSFDLIGVSTPSERSDLAIQVIKFIKRTIDIPIVWGGIHATLNPKECSQYADYVCVGEGEGAILDLANGHISAPNIYPNEVRPLISLLDSVPFADYEFDAHWRVTNKIEKFKSDYLFDTFENFYKMRKSVNNCSRIFFIHTSRGCPYPCSFCCNSSLQDIYRGKGKFIRNRSLNSCVEELAKQKERTGFDCVWITDDSFFIRDISELDEFRRLYKEKIHVPFICYADPNHVTKDKLDLLIDAGLSKIDMGIQTGSERINYNLYNRHISNNKVMEAAKILTSDSRMFPPELQIIFANPYEEKEDLLETFSLIKQLPKPFYLQTFPLVFFPGSKLYDRAIKDNIIKGKKNSGYNIGYLEYSRNLVLKKNFRTLYLNFIMRLMCGDCDDKKYGSLPVSLLNWLLKKEVIDFFSFPLISSVLFVLLKISSLTIDERMADLWISSQRKLVERRVGVVFDH